jgi:hypothetical protein
MRTRRGAGILRARRARCFETGRLDHAIARGVNRRASTGADYRQPLGLLLLGPLAVFFLAIDSGARISCWTMWWHMKWRICAR